jgi:glycosyltransferase involved in cell wall biosynthesis
VLVPVRNEAGFIGRCLAALAAQSYPRDRFEVILIDGESTDETLAEATGVPDAVLSNPGRTTASGLNLGLTKARGEVIVKVDGHTRVDSGFIAANVAALRESGADATGGPIRTIGQGPIGRAIALAMSSPFGVGDTAFRHSQHEQWTDTVPFGAYRREVFQRIGGFAEDIDRGEDDEFNYRLRKHGGRILMTPRVSADYYARSTYPGLIRQYWGYGLAKVAVLQRHPERLRLRHLVPPAFVLTLAGSSALSLVMPRLLRLTGLATAVYLAASTIASLRIASRGHWRELPFLPAAFASIHLAAGVGMIAGCLRLRRRRHGG